MTEGRRWHIEEDGAECQDVAQQPLVFPTGGIIIQGKNTHRQQSNTRNSQHTAPPPSPIAHIHTLIHRNAHCYLSL